MLARGAIVWEQHGVSRENQPNRLDDHMTIFNTEAPCRTQVAAVRVKCVATDPLKETNIEQRRMVSNGFATCRGIPHNVMYDP